MAERFDTFGEQDNGFENPMFEETPAANQFVGTGFEQELDQTVVVNTTTYHNTVFEDRFTPQVVYEGPLITNVDDSLELQNLKGAINDYYIKLDKKFHIRPTSFVDPKNFVLDNNGRLRVGGFVGNLINDEPEVNMFSTIAGNKGGRDVIRSKLGFPNWNFDVSLEEAARLNKELLDQRVAALQTGNEELVRVQASAETADFQDMGQIAENAAHASSEMIQTLEKSYKDSGTNTDTRELNSLDKTLHTIQGELVNNLAKVTALDEQIEVEKNKLDEVGNTDDYNRRRISKNLLELQAKRAFHFDAAGVNREALRSQINRIRETIRRVLHEDTTLAERVRTLFREQGITIASILTAIGMAVSTLVLAVLGTGGGTPTPAPKPPTPDKGGIKEWVKKHLQSLGRVLLAGKAAGALPGIIDSIVSWLLNLLAENLWAVVLAFGGLLLVAAREWI